MRGPSPGNARLKVLLAAVLSAAVLFPLLAAQAQSRNQRFQTARKNYERAQRLRADLEGTPENKREEKQYLGIIHLYTRVYEVAPFSSLAADALAARAEMYHQMGQPFGRAYWEKAIDAYVFLRREYPHSRYMDDALFNVAQIYAIHLKDKEKAKETYEAFLRDYPRSRHAAKAKEVLRAMKEEAAKPPVPVASSGRTEVRNIRYWNADNYTRVVVDLGGEVKFQQARIDNPDRIFIDLFGTELSTVLLGKTFDVESGLLSRIRIAENRSGVTRVVMEVGDVGDYTVFSLPDPFRLVVDIRSSVPPQTLASRKPAAVGKSPPPDEGRPAPIEEAKATLPAPVTPAKPTAAGNHTLSRALGLKIGRIVIDPGHGGHDTGTIGPTGFMEKDVVLDISRRLGKLLEEQLSAEVIYTREDDTFVPLENRIALANEKQADLFLSVHANSSRNKGVRGVETFYLNFSSDPEVLELAARENALSQKGLHELQDLVKQISTNEKIAESKELAGEVQKTLHQELRKVTSDVRNRGVKQAPFVVLVGGTMPSILVEVAFLSNAEDEKLLKSPQGRQGAAEALFSGVSKYLENINSVVAARPDKSSTE
ncbi:MAG: N-acetylmuramoyl-L-alanine amidase [Candidatus Acidiferrales bacterium]